MTDAEVIRDFKAHYHRRFYFSTSQQDLEVEIPNPEKKYNLNNISFADMTRNIDVKIQSYIFDIARFG